MSDNIKTKDRDNNDLDIAAKDLGAGVQLPRNIITDPLGNDLTPLTDVQLRATPVPVSGPLTDVQLRATEVPVSGPLTDTQLRATSVPVSGPLTDAQLRATDIPVVDDRAGNLLGNILRTLLAPLGYDKSLQRQRGTVIVESGTIGSVTAVAAVTNQVGMGGFNADMLVRAQVNAAWALNVRARIT